MKRVWKIELLDGMNTIGVWEVSRQLTEKEIGTLMQRLVCSRSDANDIVAASLRKNMRGHSALLECRRDRGAEHYALMCGENPHCIATVIEKS